MLHLSFYNLSVCLTTNVQNVIDLIHSFIKEYYTVKSGSFNKNVIIPDKEFYSKVGDNTFYFHNNQFLHLIKYLTEHGVNLKSIAETENSKDYKFKDVEYVVRPNWKLRDYQQEVYDYLIKDPVRSKMLSLPTGSGKTLTSLYTLAHIPRLLGIIILPTYIDKWVEDIVRIHEATPKDIMVIQGSASLKSLIVMAKEGTIDQKYFIFSSRTLQEYITNYENDPKLVEITYGVKPIDLFPLIGIGNLLIDETHQHFHAIYKILINTNVKFHLGLSATLLSDDNVITRIHKIVYPESSTFEQEVTDKYIDVYALSYYVPNELMHKVKTENFGSKTYSHTAFEQSVMRFPPLLKLYKSLIDRTIDDFYASRYEKKDKLLIFVATVKLATMLTDHLKALYEHLDVRRYCEQDPYENIIEPDIIVTTIISAGTAVDIPDLRVVIQTVCVSSTVANIQSLGRLRKLKDNKDTRFVYLYANNLNKQRQYHFKRKEIFQNRVTNISEIRAKY